VIPPIRSMFIPDEGYTMWDLDLDSADLRIVTWESGAQWMKDCFAAGKKPYVELAKEYYHDPSISKRHKSYPAFKKFCHGTNYLGGGAEMAGQCGLLVNEADRLQKWYFGVNPEIPKWQAEFVRRFKITGDVKNIFGNQTHFFDRIDDALVKKAIAWLPQSTIGLLINRIWANIDENLSEDVDVLLQVHDSLLGQYPTEKEEDILPRLEEQTHVVLPYGEPLIIPAGFKRSTISWGDCR